VKPVVVVLAAPSGSGKTTIARALIARWPDKYGFSVSATTRPPRRGEQDGDAYYFLTRDEVLRRRAAGEFLEWAEYAGELYGTLRREVDRVLGAGRHVLLDIEVQGARQVRQHYPPPASVAVFILPPSGQELVRRLGGRRTESAHEMAKRLDTAVQELRQAPAFDHIVVNDDLTAAVAEVNSIVDASPEARARRSAAAGGGRIETLIQELAVETDRLRKSEETR
jgi:guanylate kinase